MIHIYDLWNDILNYDYILKQLKILYNNAYKTNVLIVVSCCVYSLNISKYNILDISSLDFFINLSFTKFRILLRNFTKFCDF